MKGTNRAAALLLLLPLYFLSHDALPAANVTCGHVVDRLEAFAEGDGTVGVAKFEGFPDLILVTDAPREVCRTQGCNATVRIGTPRQTFEEGPFLIDMESVFELGLRGDIPPVDIMSEPTGATATLHIFGKHLDVFSTATPTLRMLGVSRQDALTLNYDEERVQKARTHHYNKGMSKHHERDNPQC
jgi:hypothetical protein